jgi:hypothetical protein
MSNNAQSNAAVQSAQGAQTAAAAPTESEVGLAGTGGRGLGGAGQSISGMGGLAAAFGQCSASNIGLLSRFEMGGWAGKFGDVIASGFEKVHSMEPASPGDTGQMTPDATPAVGQTERGQETSM